MSIVNENVLFKPEEQNLQSSSENVPPGTETDASNPQVVQAEATSPSTAETPIVDASQNPPVDSPPPAVPPPSIGFFGGGRLKKILIGVGILVVLIIIILIFMPKGTDKKPVKLVWWGLWESSSSVQPLIADFKRENPHISVEYIKQDPKQYRDKLMTRIKNGTGPDIFRYHNTWVPMLSEVLQPLSSDVITPPEFEKNFYPVMQKDLVQNGGIYGIPLGADTLGLFVNTELFDAAGEKVPQSWEDFVKVSKRLTVKDDGKIKTAGAALGTYGNVTHAPDIISLLFIQQGVDMDKFTTAQKDQIDAIDFYTSFSIGEQKVWDSTLDESILSFGRGNLAMYIGFSWDIFRIQSLNKDLKVKTYPVPQLVGRKSALASYWVEGVSSESPNQKAALLFMKYLAKKETAQKFYSTLSKTRSFGEPYARVDLADSLKNNELLFPFVAQLEYASSSFFASDTHDGEGGINFLSNNYLGDTVNAIVNDNSSSQTVVGTLNNGIDQVFQKYGIQ